MAFTRSGVRFPSPPLAGLETRCFRAAVLAVEMTARKAFPRRGEPENILRSFPVTGSGRLAQLVRAPR